MFHSPELLFRRAVMERLTLVANHVLASEPAALRRLQPHAGRCIELQFDGWPGMLPAPPSAVFCVTPAGLLEWSPDAVVEPALRVGIDASNPALGLLGAITGRRPKVEIAGDAAFATDLNWLFDNLRWDVEDDLARVVGAAPAHQIARIGRGIAAAMRGAAQTVDAMVRRGRGGPDDAMSQ